MSLGKEHLLGRIKVKTASDTAQINTNIPLGLSRFV